MAALTLIKIDVIHFDCTNGIVIHLHEIIFVYVQHMPRNIGYPCYIYFIITLHLSYSPFAIGNAEWHGFYRRA